MVRYIGMDVHREFAQLAVVEDGLVRDEGRIGVTPEALREWASGLGVDDQVALEATGNSDAIANLLSPLVGRVVVSNPSKTRAIAEAKVKTDKVDARILAQLLAADFLPPVWLPDERTRSLRRQVTRRAHIVRTRTRIKNQVHAILARNLCPTPPVSDLFGKTGRHWLLRQQLPADEAAAVTALLRQLDFHGTELALVDRELAIEALTDPVVARLMTIPGVDAIAGISIVAAVGDFTRFDDPDKLVAYLGLNPRVRQSGNSAPVHGRISKTGRPHPRGAGRGRLVGHPRPRPAAGFLSPRPGPTRLPEGRRRHRPETDHPGLAPGRQGPGLCLRPSQPGRAQTAQARARRRRPLPTRQPPKLRRRVQRQGPPPGRDPGGRTGRARLPADGRPLATPRTGLPHTQTLTISSVENRTRRISTS
jgi:transposase